MNAYLLKRSLFGKKIRFYLCILSLMILSIMKGYGEADNNLTNLNYFTVTDHSANGYVSFKILFYDDEADDEYTTDGHLYVTVGSEKTEILKYWTKEQSEEDWYWTYATIYDGVGEIQTKYGVVKINSQSSYDISRSGNTLTFIAFDWYYPEKYEGKEMKFSVKATALSFKK